MKKSTLHKAVAALTKAQLRAARKQAEYKKLKDKYFNKSYADNSDSVFELDPRWTPNDW